MFEIEYIIHNKTNGNTTKVYERIEAINKNDAHIQAQLFVDSQPEELWVANYNIRNI